ncbi:MAG: DUF2461 domain-containing protein [Bacteroidales bacterium]|nr:DUF2461 domain-containing protein [Bacteroidales bacterium]
MIIRNITSFLKELTSNNNKDWFHANKNRYDELKKEFESFLNLLIPSISKFDERVKYITAKDCIFRIYRDIRFSKDKTPYKTNFGAYIACGGRKSRFAGYYFHIEPSSSMLAGGIYIPDAEVLKCVRNEIFYNINDFKKIISSPKFKKYFNEIDGDKLVNIPKDFPKDFADAELLKFKSYNMVYFLKNEKLSSDDLLKLSVEIYKEMYHFNEFINKAIDVM